MSLVGGPLGGELEGSGGKVEGSDGFGNDLGAKALGLSSHVVLRRVNTLNMARKGGVFLTINSPPMIPLGKPGKFSTSVVVVN